MTVADTAASPLYADANRVLHAYLPADRQQEIAYQGADKHQ